MRKFFYLHLVDAKKSSITWTSFPLVHLEQHSKLLGTIKLSYLFYAWFRNTTFWFQKKTKFLNSMSRVFAIVFNKNIRTCGTVLILNTLIFTCPGIDEETQTLILDLHYSNILGIKIPKGLVISFDKRRLVLFGAPDIVYPFTQYLIDYRNLDVYTGYGVRRPYGGNKVKPGKIRQK